MNYMEDALGNTNRDLADLREAEERTRPLTLDELRMRNRPRVTPPYEALRDRRSGRGRRRAA